MIIAIVSVLLAGLAVALAYHYYGPQSAARANGAPLHRMVKTGLPMLELSIKLRDSDDKDLDATDSRIADDAPLPAEEERCRAGEGEPTNEQYLQGGDTRQPSQAAGSKNRPADCPQRALWYVRKHPIAFSLYFNDGARFLDWWEQPSVRGVVASRFVQGLFYGLLQSLKVKAEQLRVEGLQGEFLGGLLRDALGAQAELHYDMAHGDHGWVFSYSRYASNYAELALPAMAGLLAANGYSTPKLTEPLLEMKIGMQRLFLTEYRRRIYLAQSLEALLNVIESLPPPEQQPERRRAPLQLVVRAEAFIDNLLPALTGAPVWRPHMDFTLEDDNLGDLILPGGPWQTALHDKIYEGVLAAIPHDAFAGLAASIKLPPDLNLQDWRNLVGAGPAAAVGQEPGGLALVWDFEPGSPQGAIGVIIANPDTPQANPAYSRYLRKPALSAECGGGSVFLAASSATLLSRMQDACNLQSLSPLDWARGSEKQRYTQARLLAFFNPGVALKELFLAGGGADDKDQNDFKPNYLQTGSDDSPPQQTAGDANLEPQWKLDYLNAKAAMRKEGEPLFAGLPIFSYAGGGAGAAVVLQGREVKP
ncbi:MAG: hypothetical protein ABSB19_04720 [Methylomonas sp.]